MPTLFDRIARDDDMADIAADHGASAEDLREWLHDCHRNTNSAARVERAVELVEILAELDLAT